MMTRRMVSTLSHYRLEQEIRRGESGVVYQAIDTRTGRAVAIKTLPAEITADPYRRSRFVQEARAASALNHPNIITIHDVDSDGEVTFVAMELVEGTSLDRLIDAGPLPLRSAVDYARQMAAALAAAHASGIVHRDIKPAHIMVTPDGHVKVLDFGLAALVERPSSEERIAPLAARAGFVIGTAAYLSPEQAEGRAVDPRSDIFSVGAVLYEMLAGRSAFAGGSEVAVMTSILRDTPSKLTSLRSDVPSLVSAIVDRCLSKDPKARYEHGGLLKRDLDAAIGRVRGDEPAWWRPGVVAVALVTGVLTAGAAWAR